MRASSLKKKFILIFSDILILQPVLVQCCKEVAVVSAPSAPLLPDPSNPDSFGQFRAYLTEEWNIKPQQ